MKPSEETMKPIGKPARKIVRNLAVTVVALLVVLSATVVVAQ